MQLNRNEKGQFITKHKILLKIIGYIFTLVGLLAGSAYILKSISDWGAKNELIVQKPIVILTRKAIIVQKRQPLQVISPIVKTVLSATPSNLSEEEQIILDRFGEREFKVARLLAICESGMNPESVNWSTQDIGLMQINYPTWKQPILDKFGYTLIDLFDAKKNVEVAYWIWDRGDGQEGNGEGNYSAWVTLRTTCFLGEL